MTIMSPPPAVIRILAFMAIQYIRDCTSCRFHILHFASFYKLQGRNSFIIVFELGLGLRLGLTLEFLFLPFAPPGQCLGLNLLCQERSYSTGPLGDTNQFPVHATSNERRRRTQPPWLQRVSQVCRLPPDALPISWRLRRKRHPR